MFVKRRRLGLTQMQMAEHLGLSYAKYRCWTRGQFAKHDKPPTIHLGGRPLKPCEVCVIMRKRAGKKQWQVGRDLGVKKPVIAMMEHGKLRIERLLNYWGLDTYGNQTKAGQQSSI